MVGEEPAWIQTDRGPALNIPPGEYTFPTLGQTPADRSALITAFESLAAIEDARPEPMRNFVQRFGPLFLCEHGHPVDAPHVHSGWDVRVCWDWATWHHVQTYRAYASEFIACRAFIDGLFDFDRREMLEPDRRIAHWRAVVKQHGLEAHHRSLVWRREIGAQTRQLSPRRQTISDFLRERTAAVVTWWLRGAGFRPLVTWDGSGPVLRHAKDPTGRRDGGQGIWEILATRLLADINGDVTRGHCKQAGCNRVFDQIDAEGRPVRRRFIYCPEHRGNFQNARRQRRHREQLRSLKQEG